MGTSEDFEAAKKAHQQAPSYSTYSALANIAKNAGPEIGLSKVNVAILRNFTFEPLVPLLSGEFALNGKQAHVYLGEFASVAEAAFNPRSELYATKPDIGIISQWLDTLSPLLTTNFISHGAEDVEREIERISSYIELLLSRLREKTNSVIILNNFPLPYLPTLGILDSQKTTGQTYSIMRLNFKLIELSTKFTGIYWADYLGLFARLGYTNSKDEKHWQMSRLPFSRAALNPIAAEYGKFLSAIYGKTKKCLVLDADNTLWGGIVGEDGLNGIKLGTSYPGQTFKDFQQEILNLRQRGIILALCSKNNEQDVLEVLDSHPESLLKKEHFATWQINWEDKAANIIQIASDLNIGLDSLVFVDDNAFECNLVREKLPMVEVIELGKDILSFKTKLLSPGFFDSLIFSAEDQRRNDMYRAEIKRKDIMRNAGSLENYLAGLSIVGVLGKASELEIPRISQLTQKTNQFNLTTRRYTESEILNFNSQSNSDVFYLNLRDKVADLGIIGASILLYEGSVATIDTLLLSCRALGRGAEDALLARIIEEAKHRGCSEIRGDYISTKKNAQVKDFYARHKFVSVKDNEATSTWRLDLNRLAAAKDLYPKWIQIITPKEDHEQRTKT